MDKSIHKKMTEGASDGGRMLLLIDYMFIALLS